MRSVLISGCSSGIGRACAGSLARDGWRVFAGVRGLRPLLPDALFDRLVERWMARQ